MLYTFSYQRDIYVVSHLSPVTFTRLRYLSSLHPPLSEFLAPSGLATKQTPTFKSLYGKSELSISIPSYSELFGEHATTSFFDFRTSCRSSVFQ